MSIINKKQDMTPFDMSEKPAKQYKILMPLIWAGSYFMTRQFGLKIKKTGMKGLKPPYLVIASHQGFTDYYIGPLAVFPHRAMYVSDMEGFAAFGKWLYRGLGCIGKRRYVADINVIENMKYALSKGQSVFLYPESRHSNIGITSYIPSNMGRLAKLLNVPVVTVAAKGVYLANPFWNEEKTRKVPVRAFMECVFTKDELMQADANEVQRVIEEKLSYDEYAYQHDAGILIKDKDRAEGLELPLFICRKCGEKYHMTTSGHSLSCKKCGMIWELTEDGWLLQEGSKEKKDRIHLPDWYRWEQEKVCQETDQLEARQFSVRVEALPNEKGFVNLGEGKLIFNKSEFVLRCNDLNGSKLELHFPHKLRESVQTEYNYRQKGRAIVLSTKDCCYYIYSDDERFQPTELQFAGEYLYSRLRL